MSDETITYAMWYDFDEYSIYTANSYGTQQWMSAVYSGLLKRNSINHDWEPDLADRNPSISTDGVTFLFTLKDNLKFSNGNELNADDVEFSFHVALTPLINTNFYDVFEGFVNNESINIVDSLNVEFTLLKSITFPYTILSFPIIDQQIFEERYNRCLEGVEIDCVWNNPDGTDVVSAGPFMVENIDTVQGSVIVKANPHYYRAESLYTDKIIFKKIANKDTAITALVNGSIDILDSQYVPSLTDLSDIVGIQEEFVVEPASQQFSINHLNPYFGTGEAIPGNEGVLESEMYEDAVLVRKAMSHIVDRKFAVEEVMSGLARPAATLMPESSIGFDETLIPLEFSIEAARNNMEAAGFDYSLLGDENENGQFNRSFFEVTILSPNTAPARNQWQANYGEELPKIGIGLKEHVSTGWTEIIARTFDAYGLPDSYEEGGFDIFAIGYSWSIDWNPSGLYEDGGRCDTGTCANFINFDLGEKNTNLATLVRDYLDELDFNKRIDKVKLVQAEIFKWIPELPVFYPLAHWGFNENIVGIDPLLLTLSQQDWSQVRKLGFVSNIPTFPNSETRLDFPGGGWLVIVSATIIGRISYIKSKEELN